MPTVVGLLVPVDAGRHRDLPQWQVLTGTMSLGRPPLALALLLASQPKSSPFSFTATILEPCSRHWNVARLLGPTVSLSCHGQLRPTKPFGPTLKMELLFPSTTTWVQLPVSLLPHTVIPDSKVPAVVLQRGWG